MAAVQAQYIVFQDGLYITVTHFVEQFYVSI